MELEKMKEPAGIELPLEQWLELSRSCTSPRDVLDGRVAPFPPPELMRNVSGLTDPADFASHGVDILRALAGASPISFVEYQNILDFGCGCGRLARMFKGFPRHYTGCDVDRRHVAWINENLPFVKAVLTEPRKPLPFEPNQFDCVISISVFTHISEGDHKTYLHELFRITKPGARLFVTVHGHRALDRARDEKMIFDLLSVPRSAIEKAALDLGRNGYSFIRQNGHLTSENYEYGITFISDAYIRERWSSFFAIEKIEYGGIHDFQDIVVLRRKLAS
jgi:SAM-dependent methyltransferase